LHQVGSLYNTEQSNLLCFTTRISSSGLQFVSHAINNAFEPRKIQIV